MPNWAIGTVEITGTKRNVKKFASRFIYDDYHMLKRYYSKSANYLFALQYIKKVIELIV